MADDERDKTQGVPRPVFSNYSSIAPPPPATPEVRYNPLIKPTHPNVLTQDTLAATGAGVPPTTAASTKGAGLQGPKRAAERGLDESVASPGGWKRSMEGGVEVVRGPSGGASGGLNAGAREGMGGDARLSLFQSNVGGFLMGIMNKLLTQKMTPTSRRALADIAQSYAANFVHYMGGGETTDSKYYDVNTGAEVARRGQDYAHWAAEQEMSLSEKKLAEDVKHNRTTESIQKEDVKSKGGYRSGGGTLLDGLPGSVVSSIFKESSNTDEETGETTFDSRRASGMRDWALGRMPKDEPASDWRTFNK